MTEKDEAEREEGGRRGESIQVIARAAAILRALAGQAEGLSLGQIAKRVELPRSTVQRIVGALAAEQLVTVGRTGEGVRLGPTLTLLAAAAQTDLLSVAQPHLEALTRRVHETVNLSVFQGNQAVCVAISQSERELSVRSSLGSSFPLYSTAHGKALLAEMSDEDVTRLVGSRIEPLTANTVRSLPQLLAQLREVRERGMAFDLGERSEDIRALGVTLRLATGPRYALSIPVPSQRFEAQLPTLREELLRCREDIEAAAGVALRPATSFVGKPG
ncbi:IclR family transcriptional regulator [Cystobacter fuscus]|uniref:IclR family transcriptional regulator n=1 Tax=Cystobacter fuscus TaxID=43 RepID=UPI002B2E3BC6|nr:IclR family transcriptional regulator [Cystobacter fuscus]